MKIKIKTLIPCWKRAEILKIVLKQLELFSINNEKNFEFSFLFIISNEDLESKQIKNLIQNSKLNFQIIYYKNDFLGEKINAGINYLINDNFDYLMNFGSDDLIHPSIMELYKPYFNARHIFGVNSCYFYLNKKKCLFFDYHEKQNVIGAGRMISKVALLKTIENNNKFYTDEKQRALDTDSRNNMFKAGFEETIIKSKKFPYIVDIKSNINLNKFHDLMHTTNVEIADTQIILSKFEILKNYE
jgi:hypothetical protein